ncbi:hypothetical protein B0F90DRAFT_1813722 [Multifurca ochricompacta]|uniref:Uncharacterized protein n=1 Tax=Multifurca ochricompacta TaxID=376703 RepID=A0AAD4MCV9_9AGAM|nr:hypothetical protein B0F90DRAFT_1813722 [Multifurca ochricompacta]
MSFALNSFYDFRSSAYQRWKARPPASAFVGMSSAFPFGTQVTGGEPQVFLNLLTHIEAPTFKAPTPVTRTCSIESVASSTSNSSLESVSTDSSENSSQDMGQPSESQENINPSPKPVRKTRRKNKKPRGPNKKLSGVAYADMMCLLPDYIQESLRQEYPGCCEVVRGKDASTVQKHRFSNRHFSKIPCEYQPILPSFICPAYVGLHDKCKNAKAGRYDSTERHCKNCEGFAELRENAKIDTLYPLAITKGEFQAVQDHRRRLRPGRDVDAPPLVENAIMRLLSMLIGAPSPSSSSSQPSEAPADGERLPPSNPPSPVPPLSLPLTPPPRIHHEQGDVTGEPLITEQRPVSQIEAWLGTQVASPYEFFQGAASYPELDATLYNAIF